MGKLKARFLPEGGFSKNGAFIEYERDAPSGNETEYQRQSHLTLDITCTDFKLGMSFGVVSEYDEVAERKHTRSVSANGTIQPARWGQYSLSFLGEKGSTREVAISIRENTEGEAVTLSGVNMEGDLDLDDSHYFFLELQVHSERFSALLQELSTPGAMLHISVRADRFLDFYAEWSPSISEGRVIKFLDSKRDVENADEIPEDFWRTPEFQRELISDPDMPPVKVSVGRPLQPLLRSSDPAEDYHSDEDADDDAPAPSLQQVPSPVSDPIPALEELSKRVRRGTFWVGIWLALIFAALLLQA
ncbi:hypothetical protein P775_15070 [Puniceibacterium antarcticum]|uniref:Uncharacterized protein n=1 Tax=Puniceibacterium antarcticum TaxID=1206336 RepID=A0A2G8RED1_9RHOB|nr:hypothetical protein [Puniceibacterium antarcticum]PIL19458.1 hypothetical protein P775_15070 [Puniceibacterium antarcticum]